MFTQLAYLFFAGIVATLGVTLCILTFAAILGALHGTSVYLLKHIGSWT